ncbi:MAG: hypothetical protein JRF56_02810 [Deltaproteobacteria bacterium]|jgi:hypothetical protein|nr:hypothetical protein [Deltaproteobacteria bacterium]
MKRQILAQFKNQNGVSALLLIFIIFLILCLGALVVDLTFIYVASEQLQNAADAGALAGARELYLEEGTVINEGANLIAYNTATENHATNMRTEAHAVEVNWSAGNTGDVQRGHWSFGLTDNMARGFYPNDSLEPVELWNVDEADLDADPNFINAVRAEVRIPSPPMLTFFANIFNIQSVPQFSRDAVAYIGFAGSLRPEDVDQPIAICEDSIVNPAGEYTCSIGRFINSGQNENSETGGWTSFDQQDNPCAGTNAQEVRNLVCGDGNPQMILLGKNMAANGGEIQSAFSALYDCWVNQTAKTSTWSMTLPVINCPSNNVGTCEEVVGAVVVNVIWITGAGEDPLYKEAPMAMSSVPGYPAWDGSSITDGAARWLSFTQHYNLKHTDAESPAPYVKKSIYFLPDCDPHVPMGITGGKNFGILAKIPVLVE